MYGPESPGHKLRAFRRSRSRFTATNATIERECGIQLFRANSRRRPGEDAAGNDCEFSSIGSDSHHKMRFRLTCRLSPPPYHVVWIQTSRSERKGQAITLRETAHPQQTTTSHVTSGRRLCRIFDSTDFPSPRPIRSRTTTISPMLSITHCDARNKWP